MKEEEKKIILTFPFKYEDLKKHTSLASFLIEEVPLYCTAVDILDGAHKEAGGYIAQPNVMMAKDALSTFMAHNSALTNSKIAKMNVHAIFGTTSTIIDKAEKFTEGDVNAIKDCARAMSDLADSLIEESYMFGALHGAEVSALVTTIDDDSLKDILKDSPDILEGYDSAIIVIQSGEDHVPISRKRAENYVKTMSNFKNSDKEFLKDFAEKHAKEMLKG